MARVSVGRIVLVRLREAGRPRLYNGADEHPGLVTAVHANGITEKPLINVRVLVDGPEMLWRTSVPHEREAGAGYAGDTWRWPPRSEETG